MFKLSRLLGFFGRVLRFLVLISLPILALVTTTEIITQAPEQWGTPTFLAEVFIDALPFVVVVAAVYWLAGRFVRDVYQLESTKQGLGFLIRCQFGRLSFGPWLILKEGKIDLDRDGLVRKLGGPGGLVIFHDTAVVLARSGRLTRVVGPEFPALEPFEAIYDIINLRPKRRVYTVAAMSREGIAVSWDVEVQYKIADDNQTPTQNMPYPFSKEAVFKAATGKWRREVGHEQDMDWEGWLIISQMEATLRSILARHSLDDLIGLTEHDQIAAREALQEELEEELNQVGPRMGAKVLQVKLDNLKVNGEVGQQWIEDWRVRWQQWSEDRLAVEQARIIQTYEPVTMRAAQMPLVTLSQALQELDPAQARAMLEMRLFDIIGQMRLQEDGFFFLPAEAKAMLQEMMPDFSHSNDIDRQNQRPATNPSSSPRTRPNSKKKTVDSSKTKFIPITGQIAAGPEKSFLGDSIIGYIASIDEKVFVIEGNNKCPLSSFHK